MFKLTSECTTEGIKYAGSKRKLINCIMELLSPLKVSTVFDGFAGSTRVSQALAQSGYNVISNDKEVWSKVFADCYLLSKETDKHYQELIDHFNDLKPIDGWFSHYYGGIDDGKGFSVGIDGNKKPFQRHNAMKLDAIRTEIDKMNLSDDEKSVSLTSLILGLEKVDSTLGHYVSYLKEWSPRSYGSLRLEVPKIIRSDGKHETFTSDVFSIAKSISADVAYYDPPYGSKNEKMPASRVRYASYYHIWKTIILNDRPKLFGSACRREDSSDKVASSNFEEFRIGNSGRFIVVDELERLIQQTNTKYIVLSYSSGGRAKAEEINDVINSNGQLVDFIKISHKKNVMSHMKWTNEWLCEIDEPNLEYLFLIEKCNHFEPQIEKDSFSSP